MHIYECILLATYKRSIRYLQFWLHYVQVNICSVYKDALRRMARTSFTLSPLMTIWLEVGLILISSLVRSRAFFKSCFNSGREPSMRLITVVRWPLARTSEYTGSWLPRVLVILYQPDFEGVDLVRTRSSAVMESSEGNRVIGGAGSGMCGAVVVVACDCSLVDVE